MFRVKHLSKIAAAAAVALAFSGGIALAADGGSNQGGQRQPVRPALNAPNVVTQTGYVSVTPCRIVSTVYVGGKIAANHSRDFAVGGTAGFTGQGGTNGGCGVPIGATSVALSVTALHESHYGYLTLYAAGTGRPGVSQVNYDLNKGTTTLVNVPINVNTGRLTVFSYATSDVLIDVAGYYREPIAAYVNYNGAVLAKSGQIASVTHAGTGRYVVVFNQTIQGCAVVASNEGSFDNAGVDINTANQITVYTSVAASTSTYADTAFSLTVTC